MKPVCSKCSYFMKVDKIGVDFIEMAGTKPYRIWSTDRFRCPRCNYTVLINQDLNAYGYDYQPDFQQQVDAAMRKDGTVIEKI